MVDGTVIRQPKAYPVYDGDYATRLTVIRDWLGTFRQSAGRRPQRHASLQQSGPLDADRRCSPVENIFGAKHDLWSVNVERSYHEEFEVAADKKDAIQVAELDDVQAAQVIAAADIEQTAQEAALAASTDSEQAARTIAA